MVFSQCLVTVGSPQHSWSWGFLTSVSAVWIYHSYLSIHHLIDIQVVSTVGLLRIMLLWVYLYRLLFGHVSVPLYFYLGVEGIAESFGNSSIVASLLIDSQSSGGIDFDSFATTGCNCQYGRKYWEQYWLFETGLLCVCFIMSNWDDITSLYKKYQRRQWHPTPVLLPGKSHGWGSLVGCSP